MKNKSTRAVGKEEACGCGSSHKPGIGDTFPILWNKQESVGKQVRLQGNLVKGSGKLALYLLCSLRALGKVKRSRYLDT